MMKEEHNIIAIRKIDVVKAHQAFDDLMSKTETIMNEKACSDPDVFRRISPSELERRSVDFIKAACSDSPFNPDEVRLISGQRFPDIVADTYYGIEVKQTSSNTWTSTGSSIIESTRLATVEDIYMLFGKLGGDVPEFRCRPYQDVLYDIAVTHSPRYLINMDLRDGESIFSKMGTTYDEFRQSDNSMAQVRRYFREKANSKHRKEMPWWITTENVDHAYSFNIKLWNSLDYSEKRELQAKSMILFPEALNPARSSTKYNNTTLWLCSYNQVVNPNIRDMYSAGGKITHVNGARLDSPVAQVFNIIVEYSDKIKAMLNHPSEELYALIQEYNPYLLKGEDMYQRWLDVCCEFAIKSDVPLREWIEAKPKFEFSKK